MQLIIWLARVVSILQVTVRFAWFMPALVEKARLQLAMNDWEQVQIADPDPSLSLPGAPFLTAASQPVQWHPSTSLSE